LRKLEVAAQHLTSTIDAILDLSKIEANMLELEQLPVQFAQIFDEVESIVQVSLVAKGLRMQMTLDRIPTNLLGDPTRLRQALLNYVGNAIKFTSHGLIRVHASVVEETSESALLRIEVRDSGIGIAVPAIATLFEPFVQAESTTSRNYGGSGLGLSITKRLAQAMGGDVGVHSEVGKSSTFWLTARLKKHTLPAAEVGAAPTRDAALILKREFAGNRVLLVEDDEFNREIGCILLQDVGMQVEEAENGLAALEMALRTHYDLILMDIQMPHMDGLEATRKIRGADPRSMVPIVALSANVFMEDKVRCRDAGMNDFLTKPVEPLVLYSAMLDIFRRQIA
jgi:CheY-like chemotaxis protein/anti-sigma regulatory factor (Ser/Thr protein kinase)